jgi:hypothetical protein
MAAPDELFHVQILGLRREQEDIERGCVCHSFARQGRNSNRSFRLSLSVGKDSPAWKLALAGSMGTVLPVPFCHFKVKETS